MVRVLGFTFVLVSIAITPTALRSFAEGPFPGFTGGFGEPTCQQCHFGTDLNPPGGSLAVSGVPDIYTPGTRYPVTITLKKPGLLKGGFQLAVRTTEGPAKDRDAGTLTVEGGSLQLVRNELKTVTYVQHTPAGTRATTPGTLTWTFGWTAPHQPVPVRFDLAANASNNDESPMDDAIYTATAVVRAK